jgi:hypothetical protein
MAISKEQKLRTKKVLEKSFSKEDCVQCYFLKFSKGLEGHQHKIVFKTRKKIEPAQVKEAEKNLRIEFGEDFELFRWSEIIGKFIPKSKVYKIPFFDSREVKLYSPWRQCPLGYHWVREHDRQKKTLEDVDPHCRRNPSNKDLLKGEEMDFISNTDLFLNPSLKVSNISLEIKGVNLKNQNQYDELISGWTAYWNDVFKLKDPLHPNHVKALLATESKFIKTAIGYGNNPKTGPARGLMQITEITTRRMKNGKEKDYLDHFIELNYEDLWEPNRNICAGVRQIFRKREAAKYVLKRDPTWFEVMMDYKGWVKGKSKHANTAREELTKYFLIMGMEIH